MNMEENVIKDRIQDVRERFLSGNQIEEIRQNVRTLVDERLDEFQNAQNNAFKELETAIDKLESHQREMIAYFNKQLNSLEEEQKASNSEVLKLASIQNVNLLEKNKKTDPNIIPKKLLDGLSYKKLKLRYVLLFFSSICLIGILILNTI